MMSGLLLKRCVFSTKKSRHIPLLIRALRYSQTEQHSSKILPSVLEAFQEIVGEENVSTANAIREHHGHDESHHSYELPDAVLFPSTTDEVSKVASVCYKHDLPIIPFGMGTGIEGGVNASRGAITVALTKMTQIEQVNADDFDCTVQAGVTRQSLNNYLRDTGLFFSVDPGAEATLCGMAATSASGTNAYRYGTMRENVLNLEVVLADGRVLHTAGPGRRTRKTSAGYNLTNLFVGSEGTLGLITKATLRLYGIPECTVAAVCHFPSIQTTVDATVMILQHGIPMARIEFLDEVMVDATNRYSMTDHTVAPSLFLEFSGIEKSVDEQVQVVGDIIKMSGGSDFIWAKDADERATLWKARHAAFYASTALRKGSKLMPTDVCVPISRLPEIIVKTKEDVHAAGVVGPIVGHVGDGNFHVVFPVCDGDKGSGLFDTLDQLSDKMIERAQAMNGTCTGEHGIGLGKRNKLVTELGETGVDVMRQIKMALDPKNLMNPNKVLP